MNRVLPLAFLLALSAPAFGQAVDAQGAKQLSDELSRYVGKQALNEGILKISTEGNAYKVTFDMKALAAKVPKQDLVKFDFPPITLLVKPNGDGGWSVSSDFSTSGSFEVNNSEGPATGQIDIKDGKFAGVYDPELGAFRSGESSIAGMTMTSRMSKQITDLNVGSGSSKFGATKSAGGGVDLNVTQSMVDFAETVKLDNRSVGAVKTSELVVDLTAKAIRTKPLLDLLAFAVAHEDEAQLKADQAELKALLLSALPLWERMDGTYTFRNFVFETYAGNLGASQLTTSYGADGIARAGKYDYRIKAKGLSFPYVIPGWAAKLMPTELDVKFGGVNIDLDSMSRKAIETFDLNKNPPLPAEFGDQIKADFMANAPKFIVDHSVFSNGDTEVALEGDMTFPDGDKPDANLTIDVTGYDKIVASLQEAAKTDPEASQAFTGALAVKGFAKTLPDGRVEWVINAKHDGSVTVNGAMLKGPDPAVEDGAGQDASPGEGNSGGAGAKLQP
ncbi:hypothetical protein FJV76_04610 [Mesorhizobium sp. WSM4303]|uniref:hypothetical protein n=1 Tax=unclassified Mesorhizobium TaxID=325217 RepID=UPI00115DC985|nr:MULTISPECIES: hypothetical protein [unclassified Mesorhizobium]TRD00427.1 hypothetical protein FJV77_00870 [Mesorhizobium sp. WSM4306]TRD07629.1 hypothetical protein FJV76_04610 [Mesorhizobium sp. WSM4303]